MIIQRQKEIGSSKIAMFAMLALVGIFVAVLGGTKYWQISKAMAAGAHHGPPPQAVTTTIVAESSWQPKLEVVGSLAPSQGVTLAVEEDGKVSKIAFESGAHVKAGDVLVELDTSVEQAQLQSAQARLELARINLRRVQTLFKQSAISEQAVNNAVSEEKAADGDVKAIEGTIARKKIIAPFDGRAGIRMVNVGQYMQKSWGVVPLHALDPMYLDFSVPEREMGSLSIGQTIKFTVDVFADEEFTGKITAIDPQVTPSTRNVKAQATLANPGERLMSGMFAKVKIYVGEQRQVLAIPSSAINYAPYGNSVFVVEKMKGPAGEYLGVRQQFVTLGGTEGDLVEVSKGLEKGQEIVTSGTFKLQGGMPVIINNTVLPSSETSPKVENT